MPQLTRSQEESKADGSTSEDDIKNAEEAIAEQEKKVDSEIEPPSNA
jgi:hypothetical protein